MNVNNKDVFTVSEGLRALTTTAMSCRMDISDVIIAKGVQYAAASLSKQCREYLSDAMKNAGQAFDWTRKLADNLQIDEIWSGLNEIKIQALALHSFSGGVLFKTAANGTVQVKSTHPADELKPMEGIGLTPKQEEERRELILHYVRFAHLIPPFEEWLKKPDWKEYIIGYLLSGFPSIWPKSCDFNHKLLPLVKERINNAELSFMESLYLAPYVEKERLHSIIDSAEQDSFIHRSITWGAGSYTLAGLLKAGDARLVSQLALLLTYSPDKMFAAIKKAFYDRYDQGAINAASHYIILTSTSHRIEFFKLLGEFHTIPDISQIGLLKRNAFLRLCLAIALEQEEEICSQCLANFPKDLLQSALASPCNEEGCLPKKEHYKEYDRLQKVLRPLQALCQTVFPPEEALHKFLLLYAHTLDLPDKDQLKKLDLKELLIALLDHIYPYNDSYQFPLNEKNQLVLRKLLNEKDLSMMESLYFASYIPWEKLQHAVVLAGAGSFVHREFFLDDRPYTIAKLVEQSRNEPILCQKISRFAMLFTWNTYKMTRLGQDFLNHGTVSRQTLQVYLALCTENNREDLLWYLRAIDTFSGVWTEEGVQVTGEWIGKSFRKKIAKLQSTVYNGLAAFEQLALLRSTCLRHINDLEKSRTLLDQLCFPALSQQMQEKRKLPEISNNLLLYRQTWNEIVQRFTNIYASDPEVQYRCPISHEYIVDPVYDEVFSGVFYDKSSVQEKRYRGMAYWPVSGKYIVNVNEDMQCKLDIFAWRLGKVDSEMSSLVRLMFSDPNSNQMTEWQIRYVQLENEKDKLKKTYNLRPISEANPPDLCKMLNESDLSMMQCFYFAGYISHEKLQKAVETAGTGSFVHQEFFLDNRSCTLAQLVERSKNDPVFCKKISLVSMLYSWDPYVIARMGYDYLDGGWVIRETIQIYLALCSEKNRMEVLEQLGLLSPICEDWIDKRFEHNLAQLLFSSYEGLAGLRRTWGDSWNSLEKRRSLLNQLCFPILSQQIQEKSRLPEISNNMSLYLETWDTVYDNYRQVVFKSGGAMQGEVNF